jgi:hypothetical protein
MRRYLSTLLSAVHVIKNAKLFSAVTVAIIAIVLALVSTFASLNEVLLVRDLPYPDPERLVAVRGTIVTPQQTEYGNTTALAKAWRSALTDLGQFELSYSASVKLRAGGVDSRVAASYVTPGIFQLLGARASEGVTFDQLDQNEQMGKVVILSHALRARLFPARGAPIDTFLEIDGTQYRIVGVMAENFLSARGLRATEEGLWLPLEPSAVAMDQWAQFSSELDVIGRLKGGAGLADLHRRLPNLTAELMEENAKGQVPPGVTVTAGARLLRDAVIGDAYKAGVVMLCAAALLAALGGSIVSTMWLARAARRRSVLALHAALGARLKDLVLETVMEIAVLFGSAALIAFPLSAYLIGVIKALGAGSIPRLLELSLDLRFVLVLLLLTAVALCLFAYVAVRPLARVDMIEELRGAVKGKLQGGQLAARKLILSFQFLVIALSFLFAAIILFGALERALMKPGYQEEGASVVKLELPDRLASAISKTEVATRAIGLMRERKYAATVALADTPPISSMLMLQNASFDDGESTVQLQINGASEPYLRDLGLRLEAGRLLQDADISNKAHVMVLSETAAKSAGGLSAIGKFVLMDKDRFEIVGIVNDIVNPRMPDEAALFQAYVPFKHGEGVPKMTLILFHPGATVPSRADVARLIGEIDPAIFIDDYRPLTQLRGDLIERYVLKAKISVAIVLITCAMAIAGIYAVISYMFSSAASALATKIALGAPMRVLCADLMRIIAGPLLYASFAFIGTVLVAATGIAAVGETTLGKVYLFGASALGVTVVAAMIIAYLSAQRLIRTGYLRLLTALY